MPRRIALYARVSTSDQTVEPQLHALRQYTLNWGVEAVEYVDHGISGARDRRPALDHLMADARRRRFDVLAVTKLDRLARSVRHLTTLAGELEALGIGLVVLDQAIDTTTPSGRLLFHVLGSIAEFERDLIRERVTAGIAAARRRGQRFGRPEALTRESRERLARLAQAGHSSREIAALLGTSKSTAAREVARLGTTTASRAS
jgi:DNA invertase Pin-like site-specific DNA recombinase